MKPPLRLAVLASAAAAAASVLAQSPAAPDLRAGAATYDTLCAFCHGDAGGGGQGPPLAGVLGRRAATAPGFAYSPALQASGLTWTPNQLDVFLANPTKAVPGTAMPMIVPDAAERRNLIAFLGTLH